MRSAVIGESPAAGKALCPIANVAVAPASILKKSLRFWVENMSRSLF
jgi:hypothetical protein